MKAFLQAAYERVRARNGKMRFLIALVVVVPAVTCVKGEDGPAKAPPAAGSAKVSAPREVENQGNDNEVIAQDSQSVDAQIATLCASCHAAPKAEALPKSVWPAVVSVMFELERVRAAAENEDPLPGNLQRITRWFMERAPLSMPIAPGLAPDSGPSWSKDMVHGPRYPGLQSISHVNVVRLNQPEDEVELLVCDMQNSLVWLHRPGSVSPVPLAEVSHPAHAEVVDLDRDGRRDLLVASLGSFLPADHDRGSVVWLRGQADGGYAPEVLLDKVGRVADARAADLDGDGDLDIAVGVFGWRSTGKVLWLENRGTDGEGKRFVAHELDPRAGAVTVEIADIDGDGRLDIVALLAQEHEVVLAWLGRDAGRFEARTVWEAQDPGWGSNRMVVTDFDRDGDRDVLMVNGDIMDFLVIRPIHGVHLLDNRGGMQFEARQLLAMPGAMDVAVGDIDGDGDSDIAVTSLLLKRNSNHHQLTDQDSVVWLEQKAPGQFVPHSLEKRKWQHAAVALVDFDGDGADELAVGTFQAFAKQRQRPALEVYRRNGP